MRAYQVLIISVLILTTGLSHCQNLLNVAFNDDSIKVDVLFPEKDGDIFYQSIVIVPSINAASINDIGKRVDTYVKGLSMDQRIKVTTIVQSEIRKSYKVSIEIGDMLYGLDFMGAPIYYQRKNLSEISFDCSIDIADSTLRYTLNNFYTKRRMLKGEAKSEGQSNTIHWQRVNSLIKERDEFLKAQKKVDRKCNESVYDYNLQIANETLLYCREYDIIQQFIGGFHQIFQKQNGFYIDYKIDMDRLLPDLSGNIHQWLCPHNDLINNQSQTKQNKESKPFLLQQGNNVYVRSGKQFYELAGKSELIKQIIIDGFWNVVSDISAADFVVDYNVDLKGKDKAFITISSPDGAVTYEKFDGSVKGTSESISENREVARLIYMKTLFVIQMNLQNKPNAAYKQFPLFLID